jgi:hypothetical protein
MSTKNMHIRLVVILKKVSSKFIIIILLNLNHQPKEPTPPLNGPIISEVIQPP